MKVLTVVGQTSSRTDFESILDSCIKQTTGSFIVKAIVPLSKSLMDGEIEVSKFLAYVETTNPLEELAELDAEDLERLLKEKFWRINVHESQESAMTFAEAEYGGEAFAPFMAPITAQEIRDRDIFMALAAAGETHMLRCLFEGKNAIALVHVCQGGDPDDQFVTPYAILVNEEISKKIELPFRSNVK